MDRIAYVKEGFLDPDCRRERLDSEDSHRSLQVVCKHVQAHLGTHSRQCLGQEVRRPHPHLERAERMLDSLTSDSRGARRAACDSAAFAFRPTRLHVPSVIYIDNRRSCIAP